MTDIQFLSRVTGWPVNVSDANPLLGLRTFTAWGEIDGVKVCIQVQKRRRNRQPDITHAIPEDVRRELTRELWRVADRRL